ncbi:MAG: DUF559 domain-containing protein [Tidjanibacter sp.]|nr:DUF559 domain-containing protein [Tidjanibacter sp.]
MKLQRAHNQPEQKELRRKLRAKSTPAESALWNVLRAKQLCGTHWYRQYSIGEYVLDFYCPAARMCVELDGLQHQQEEELVRDGRRTAFLESRGVLVLRVPNDIVLTQSDVVVSAIMQALYDRLGR